MTQKSKIAILECLEYVISLFPETNRGYNASRPYCKALKEFIRDNNLDHERKENTIPEKISASEGKTKENKQKAGSTEQEDIGH